LLALLGSALHVSLVPTTGTSHQTVTDVREDLASENAEHTRENMCSGITALRNEPITLMRPSSVATICAIMS
jgi:hypothetical protein